MPTSSVHRFASTDLTVLIHLIALKLRNAVATGDTLLDFQSTETPLTKFEAQSKPNMTVDAYLTRVVTLTPIPVDAVLLSLIYLNRISSPGCLIEPQCSRLFRFPETCVDELPLNRDSLFPVGTTGDAPTQNDFTPPERHVDTVPDPSQSPSSQTWTAFQKTNAQPRVPINSLTIHRLILSVMVLAAKFVSDGFLTRNRTSKVGGVTELEMGVLERDTLQRLNFELCWKTWELEAISAEILAQSSFTPSSPKSVSCSQSSTSSWLSSPASLTSHLSLSTASSLPADTQHLKPKNPPCSDPLLVTSATGIHLIKKPVKPPKRMIFVRSQLSGTVYQTKYPTYYRRDSYHPHRRLDDDGDTYESSSPSVPGTSFGPRSSSLPSSNDLPAKAANRTSLVVTKLEQNCLRISHAEIYSV